MLVYLTHNIALPVLKIIRKPEIFPYDMRTLYQFPEATLGKDLGNFIVEKKLKLLSHYARHDIKHILLQYDTTDEGEVCLQCFMLGNGHISFPVLATVIFGFITMPRHWQIFKKAYWRGKNAACISGWKWFEILQQPTALLRGKINTHF